MVGYDDPMTSAHSNTKSKKILRMSSMIVACTVIIVPERPWSKPWLQVSNVQLHDEVAEMKYVPSSYGVVYCISASGIEPELSLRELTRSINIYSRPL
jgi:hypothetical protein